MADPTYSEVWDVIRAATWVLYQDFMNLVSTTRTERYIDHEDDLKTVAEKLDAPNLSSLSSALTAYRSTRVGAILGSRGLVDAALVQMARVIGAPEGSPDAILFRLDEYMREQAPIDTVVPIGGSFGSPTTGGSNVGTGVMTRITVDRDGLALELNRQSETLTFRCVVDKEGGATAGAEIFSVRGEPIVDIIEQDGSAINGTIPTDSADTSLLQNPSFGDLDGDSIGALDTIPSWTIDVGSAGDFALSEDNVHRTSTLEATARSLVFNQGTTSTISQTLDSAGAQVTDPIETPWDFGLWYNNDSGAGGTLTLGLGTYSVDFTVASGSTGWVFASLADGGASPENLYYDNWKETGGAAASIKWSGAAGLLADNVFLGPMRGINGTFGNIFASDVDFLFDDRFTLTDTRNSIGAQGVNQWAFDLLYGRTLAAAASAGAATIVDQT